MLGISEYLILGQSARACLMRCVLQYIYIEREREMWRERETERSCGERETERERCGERERDRETERSCGEREREREKERERDSYDLHHKSTCS